MFVSDIWLREEGAVEGHIIVLDLQGLTLGHVARLEIMAIKRLLYYLQEAIPLRLKGLHFINIVPFVDKIISLMKPFMKKELWDIFHLHSNMDNFYEFVDQEILPKNYVGGTSASYDEVHGNF